MQSMQLHTARHKRADAWQSGQWLCGRHWKRGLKAAWISPRRRLNVLQSGVADVLAECKLMADADRTTRHIGSWSA